MTERKDHLLSLIRKGDSLDVGQQVTLAALLSVPSMMAQMVHILMQYIDAAMVGSLGAQATASIGLVSTTIWLFGSLNSCANVGFCVQVAHALGANRPHEARSLLRQSLLACIVFSAALSVVGCAISPYLPTWLRGGDDIVHDATIYFFFYSLCVPFAALHSLCCGMLRSAGNTQTPCMLNILICLLDVVFNYFLIFPTRTEFGILVPGAGLGVTGAILGTALSYVIVSLCGFYLLCFRDAELRLALDDAVGSIWRRFLPSRSVLRESVRISLPMAMQHILMRGAQITTTVIVAPLGTVAMAANSFGIIIEALCYMPGFGVSDAATALVAQSLGAKRPALAKSLGRISILLGVAVMSFMAVVMYVFSPDILSVMTPIADVRTLGTAVLRIEAFAEPLFAASIVCYGVFVGARDTLAPCIMNLTCIWVVRVGLSLLLVRSMGLQGVWIAMATELSCRGILYLLRFRSGKWMKSGVQRTFSTKPS